MNYQALVASIRQVHDNALVQVARTVNRSLILRNWVIGAYLVEFEQNGEDRAKYGKGLLKHVAKDLTASGISGCSRQMLDHMRIFYAQYPQISTVICSPAVSISGSKNSDAEKGSPLVSFFTTLDLPIRQPLVTESDAAEKSQPLVGKLPAAPQAESSSARLPLPLPAAKVLELSWSHLLELIRLNDPWKRAFYENECLKGNWSKRQLQRQIGSLLYERTGLSTDKQAVINHARQQATETPQKIADLIRDPYILEFTGLAEKATWLERDLETLLLDHLQAFLLELGTGFCFEARQKRITVGNEHDYLDLVFYHRILRCHLLIDLKVRSFQHGDAGQMNFYLNYWKDQMMQPGDQPPVGLILCADKEQPRVDYATAGLDHHLFVSRYLNKLPSIETLQNLIERDTATWLQVREEATQYNANPTKKSPVGAISRLPHPPAPEPTKIETKPAPFISHPHHE